MMGCWDHVVKHRERDQILNLRFSWAAVPAEDGKGSPDDRGMRPGRGYTEVWIYSRDNGVSPWERQVSKPRGAMRGYLATVPGYLLESAH